MASIIEYITQNYGYFLIFLIFIFLAIIGYFAEKTNNVQKEKIKKMEEAEQDKNNSKDIESQLNAHSVYNQNKEIQSSVEEENVEKNIEPFSIYQNNPNLISSQNEVEKVEENKTQEEVEKDVFISESGSEQIIDSRELQEQKMEKNIFENEDFNKFSVEFDELLPQKETIESDLLSDIDDLELDKTQKFNFNDALDLTNIQLPKIKKMEEEKDIWDF